jgi:hypothetical protein
MWPWEFLSNEAIMLWLRCLGAPAMVNAQLDVADAAAGAADGLGNGIGGKERSRTNIMTGCGWAGAFSSRACSISKGGKESKGKGMGGRGERAETYSTCVELH